MTATGPSAFCSTPLTSRDEEWIQWFCSLQGNDYFVEVDERYIEDNFNLTGLSAIVPFYDYARGTILNTDPPEDVHLTEDQLTLIELAAEMLYGLIHSRFLLTTRGMELAAEKYKSSAWGQCPRVRCCEQAVLPVGQSDVIRESTVKLFCPQCGDIFYPRGGRYGSLDGAYFGTTFAHLFVMCQEELFQGMPKPYKPYVPCVFGFRVRHVDPCGGDTVGHCYATLSLGSGP
eukprot:Hpha_TRINITY_DN16764_c0_g1::TRINITY_DN16764_c0_g1_i1::g.78079::m.78079/K03115/CSNK2B; casein kinase II subunit beta